jgi:4,5-DOPA dioxygenase extradiol
MPAAFIGHGSPMNTLERNRYTAQWRAIGAALPRPRAVLVISAHWYVPVTAVTAMSKPRTIHDFYGFPQALFDFQYAAPGDPILADEVAEAAKPDYVGQDQDTWGLDHGTWSVLAHLLPKADVPVVQLSINSRRDLGYHLKLATRLSALRNKGILILGSGNVVHNLRAMRWSQPELAFDWAFRFDEAVREVMTQRPAEVPKLFGHADFAMSAPTPEHFLPLVYLAALAVAARKPAQQAVSGCTFGSISMASYSLDAVCPQVSDTKGPAILPPTGIPADETNL